MSKRNENVKHKLTIFLSQKTKEIMKTRKAKKTNTSVIRRKANVKACESTFVLILRTGVGTR